MASTLMDPILPIFTPTPPPVLAITLGDPLSINARALIIALQELHHEITSLAHDSSSDHALKIFLIGHRGMFLSELEKAHLANQCHHKIYSALKGAPIFPAPSAFLATQQANHNGKSQHSDTNSEDDSITIKPQPHFWPQVLKAVYKPCDSSGIYHWIDLSSSLNTLLSTTPLSNLPLSPLQLSKKQRGQIAGSCLEALTGLSQALERPYDHDGRPQNQKHTETTTPALAVYTAPVDKSCLASAGYTWSGQSEFFFQLWQKNGIMVLAGSHLRVGLLSHHLPLRQAADAVSRELVIEKALALYHSTAELRTWGITLADENRAGPPRLGICGLNPHLSDGGLLGHEEAEYFEPAVKELRYRGLAVDLLSADSAFYRAYKGEYHAILAAYHDQGLGPLKMVDFEGAVNMSLGLRHFRCAPAHGPASELYDSEDFFTASTTNALKNALTYLEYQLKHQLQHNP